MMILFIFFRILFIFIKVSKSNFREAIFELIKVDDEEENEENE